MANNPYVNKVVFGSATLVDLTGTTATADKILTGYGAFGADGAWMDGTATGGSSSGAVWQDGQGYVHLSDEGDIELQTKSVTPTESAQTVSPDAGYYALSRVNVGAISSSYVGSGITRRSSSDLTASGATVTVPSGYYSAQASKSVASGTAGTPTATKGTVSNHQVSVTPSVTNTSGYISGGTKTGTAVTVTASELVSGTYSVTSSGTKDVTNYASISVPSGTAGTPTATKGTVSNHSVSVTPSVTNTSGYITGSTKTGTAVIVTASELASGNKEITQNGTGIDVVGYSTVSVDVSGGSSNVVVGSFTTTSTSGTTQTVTVPYTGSGYPIMIHIEVDNGVGNWVNNSLNDKIVGQLVLSKSDWSTPMQYRYDYWMTSAWYTAYSGELTSHNQKNGYLTASAPSNSQSPYEIIFVNSATQFTIGVRNDGSKFGLNPSTVYHYVIVYSS